MRSLPAIAVALGLLHPDLAAAQDPAVPPLRQITQVSPTVQRELVAIRDTAWRAYFAGDTAVMQRIFPQNFIAIGWGGGVWNDRAATIADATQLLANGGRLVSLVFPHTEIQLFGDLAVVYSLYAVVFEVDGETIQQSGRATEIFHRRNGSWEHPSWHLDSGR